MSKVQKCEHEQLNPNQTNSSEHKNALQTNGFGNDMKSRKKSYVEFLDGAHFTNETMYKTTAASDVSILMLIDPNVRRRSYMQCSRCNIGHFHCSWAKLCPLDFTLTNNTNIESALKLENVKITRHSTTVTLFDYIFKYFLFVTEPRQPNRNTIFLVL